MANPTIRRVRRLRKRAWRERKSQFLAEGHRTVEGALDAGAALDSLLYTPRAARLREPLLARAHEAGAKLHEISEDVMAYLTSVSTPPDVLAVAPIREQRLASAGGTDACGVLLARVHDPATAGGVMATAAAAGATTAIFTDGTVEAFSPKVVRSARGAHFRLGVIRDVAEHAAVDTARAGGARIVTLGERGPAPWDADLSGRILLVIGEQVRDEPVPAGEPVAVPGVAGMPSLSARAAVVLYEWVRQRGLR